MTTNAPAALGRIAALEPARFAAEHWGGAPLLSRAAQLPTGFTDLLDPAAVDELVSRRGLRTPFLRMAKDGTVISSSRFTRGGGAGAGARDQVADDKVLSLLADGATLVLQGLHRTWPPLIDFANTLAAELGHPVQVNAYITPPQNQGFSPHYDVHDVFVLQIVGSKRWFIHEPVRRHPLPDDDWRERREAINERTAEPALIDTVLAAGDSLYLPRGYLHSAQALGEMSIHLTVGVHPITRYRLVRELLEASAEDPQLRTSLPLGVDLGDPAAIAGELRETIAALRQRLDELTAAQLAEPIATYLREETRPEPLSPLAVLSAAADLAPDTALRMRRGLRAQLAVDDDSVVLRLIDTKVRIPIVAQAAVKTVLDGAVFTPADLPGLEPDEQLVIARRLLREGVVVPVDSTLGGSTLMEPTSPQDRP